MGDTVATSAARVPRRETVFSPGEMDLAGSAWRLKIGTRYLGQSYCEEGEEKMV